MKEIKKFAQQAMVREPYSIHTTIDDTIDFSGHRDFQNARRLNC